MVYCSFSSPVGLLLISADERGICALDFDDNGEILKDSNQHIELLKKELEAYFAGKLKNFSVPLNPKGTFFQQGVWRVLQRIPYGETISYSHEAELLKQSKAVRAVANANGKNPIAIVIPCHRVIAKDGSIGGYSSGVWRKEYLLALEQKYR
ncbi:methylated-DNA--[protein]-cysteine S-methyltransferase [Sulfurospirillum barnesii]|uniref:Methylated-DNA--protein-cysteine methyltransferase n=1 Tax=Sulfurospirillum barnesii (strain ATCC 700032 / DSM 10660 / SES-3) TaxID=760154 RepID=I3Y0Q8_SULBS|nr:methylated-DNA--[protein]-cysteine S-methyltransferase [Sulfurospirillum barnesii]AFL69782.1 methylated DNA-protein cysteine methyltransferase [Sulfurospirillum barnesii SES-3]